MAKCKAPQSFFAVREGYGILNGEGDIGDVLRHFGVALQKLQEGEGNIGFAFQMEAVFCAEGDVDFDKLDKIVEK